MENKRKVPFPAWARSRPGAAIAGLAVVALVAAALLAENGALARLGGTARVAPTSTVLQSTATVAPTAEPTPSPTSGPSVAPATGGAWQMYGEDDAHDGYDGAETAFRPGVPAWNQLWVAPDWHALTAQVVVANNLAYIGTWEGYERAIHFDSPNPVWKTYLGVTSASCKPYTLQKDPGVASTPEVLMVNGRSVLLVGGGDAQMYALDALTGAVIWRTRLGASPDHFIWSSPIVYGGSVYVGLASTADCPMVAGQLFKLDIVTGAIQQTFTTVPQGCTGGEVWDAPTVDDAAGVVLIATGSAGSCSQPESYADAIVALNASDLSVLDAWQVPANQRVANGGFRGSPTLFRAELGHAVHDMVGAGNKNGMYYALALPLLSDGPVWQQRLAVGGGCVNYMCTQAPVGTAAWDGNWVIAGGGATTIAGKSCPGSVQAFEPATGKIVWQTCLQDGPVTAAITLANSGDNEEGIVCAGPSVIFFTVRTGATWWGYTDPEFQNFYAPASVSNGLTWWPNVDGGMHEQKFHV